VDWRTVSGRAGHADGHMTLATYAHFQQAQERHDLCGFAAIPTFRQAGSPTYRTCAPTVPPVRLRAMDIS
jgi:hypothetical protein